jgi:cell cycle arrest protein BUB2
LTNSRQSPDCPYDTKIKNDGFRTFKGNEQFWSIVDEDTIVRVLRAVSFETGYVQGMNVLLGPFLRVMPEYDSFLCFRVLVTEHIASYVTRNLEGVHRAIGLSKRCLPLLDPELYQHIVSKLHDLSIFSVRFVLTMMANTQPLDEVIRVWDSIFAFGTEFSLFVFFAFLISMRTDILAAKTANKYVMCFSCFHACMVVYRVVWSFGFDV